MTEPHSLTPRGPFRGFWPLGALAVTTLWLAPPLAWAQTDTTTAPRPAPSQDEVETYRVMPGDSLSSIAAKMYQDPNQWRRIYEANRATLPSPNSVRVGQTLIIPR